MKVICICPYPTGVAPSQRFRFEQYFEILQRAKIEMEVHSFMTRHDWERIQRNPSVIARMMISIRGLVNRMKMLADVEKFDLVFIHREAAPVGPPVFEWIVGRFMRKKIIYDFDDAIWLTDNSKESQLTGKIRWRSKVRSIIAWSYKVSCGNDYLATFARRYNANVMVNPTTVDTMMLHPRQPVADGQVDGVTVGWTGSHSTLKYLEMIIPALQTLETRFPRIQYVVVADKDPKLPLKNFRFLSWNNEDEAAQLQTFDIGIMPLPDDDWTRGKCGFKALQYMAMGIPAVVSPVGANREIVTHGIEGYWCTTIDEWVSRLEELVLDADKRKEMGMKGRQKVVAIYSVSANASTFLSLFQ